MCKYFTLKEMCASSTAKRLGIDNTPNGEVKCHLKELMGVLDLIREAWGSGIVVNSGYRCEALNKAVGGAKESAHLTGYAADIRPLNGQNKKFHKFAEQFLLDNNIEWDQLINEYDYSWTHLGIKNKDGRQRRMSFAIK